MPDAIKRAAKAIRIKRATRIEKLQTDWITEIDKHCEINCLVF